MPYDLQSTVAEIERLLSEQGWDQPPKLYALVATGELRENEPALAEMLANSDPEGLTPVEQEPVEGDIAELLDGIEWPPLVLGCAFVNEVMLLPDGATAERPEEHPGARDVRIAVGVLRGGERSSVLRIRGTGDGEDDVLTAPDLVPNLSAALLGTLGE